MHYTMIRAGVYDSSGAGVPAFTPADVTGHLATWRGVDLASGSIAGWTAGIGLPLVWAQATGSQQPTVGTAGGKKFALFDGVDDYLDITSLSLNAAPGFTAVVASRTIADGNSLDTILAIGDGGSTNSLSIFRKDGGTDWQVLVGSLASYVSAAGPAYALGTDTILGQRVSAGGTLRFMDGTTQVSSSAAQAALPLAPTGWRLGADTFSAGRTANRRIYGVSLFAADISDGNYASVVAFLRDAMPP